MFWGVCCYTYALLFLSLLLRRIPVIKDGEIVNSKGEKTVIEPVSIQSSDLKPLKDASFNQQHTILFSQEESQGC